MVTIFFIDSENVGDTWFDLLDYPDSKLVVFYTNHSPKISYTQAMRLINVEHKPVFVKCYEGNNGLDFQLASCLGYELHVDASREMIIVSKDTGFDAVVNFWRDRGMNVRRCSISEVLSYFELEREPVSESGLFSKSFDMNKKVAGVDISEIYTIVNCIGKENLSYINIAFTHFYGNSTGACIYKYMKEQRFDVPSVSWESNTRMKKLIEVILTHLKLRNELAIGEFAEYLTNNIVLDRNVMKMRLKCAYPEIGEQLHKILKPFYSMLVKIKLT